MSIQRWECTREMARDDGEWVEYADHEAAVAAERERLGNYYTEQAQVHWDAGYGFGQADERAACIAAIEAVVPEENVFGINVVSTTALIAALRARGEQA